MPASLATQYYQLGKYAPNDLTDYLTTYNGTMDKIDSAIHAAQDAADTAQAQADANLNNIASLSQGLNATNKNVENLGKAQTAQGVEIDGLKESVNNIEIGDFTSITFSEAHHSGSGYGYLRKIGKGVQGYIQTAIDSATYQADRAYSDINLVDICYVAGNVLNLPAETWQLTQALKFDSEGNGKGFMLCAIYYDNATGMTRVCARTNGSTLVINENVALVINA